MPDLRFPIPPASPLQSCMTCGAKIHWIVTARGKRMPVNRDGTNHRLDCKTSGFVRGYR